MHSDFNTLLTTARKENAFKMSKNSLKYIVFDHDGTLVKTGRDYQLFSGIKELVVDLNSLGVKCYVWTARNRYSTVEILKSLDMITLFEDISCSTDCEPKPSPQGLIEMLPLELPMNSVAVVGDSFTDMIGAKKVGALAIGALWNDKSTQAQQSLTDFGADYLCMNVEECNKLLKSLVI